MKDWAKLTKEGRLEAIRPLWNEGKSARDIAMLFRGATRNGVIGVLHRAGLKWAFPRATQALASMSRPKTRLIVAGCGAVLEKPPGQPPRAFAEPSVFARNGRAVVPLTALQFGMCRWPLGDPAEPGFGFCGCRAQDEQSYCAEHRALAYAPPKPGKPRTANELMRSLRRYVA